MLFKKEALWGLLLAAACAALISPFASKLPDVLEKVARERGFSERERQVISSPIPEYAVPGIKSKKLAAAISAGIGIALSFGVSYVLMSYLRKRAK